ncbi:structural protein [Bacillus phage Riggi]|uniref:Structural protein n=1 Tax=Bacillus phage Riggi TaxID=2884426 RepID=U5PW85_9CAUD|nr:virion structural protein [Bacillus phage Riggi]AGY48189.1 structural protein [Bacillus phage Riggi]
MAVKKFPIQWIGVYRADRNSYVGGNNIRVGGSADYQSYIGIPTAVRTAINTSRTSPKLRFVMNVTTGAEFDFGAHKETSNKGSGKMPYYNYIGLHPIYGTGWRTTDLTSAFLPSYKSGSRQGIVIYGARNNSGQAYGKTGNSNEAYFEVEGTWNTPPTAPKITTPTSTTVATNSLQVKWDASSDPETATSELTYQVQIFNGSTWSSSVTTGKGVTSYSYNTSNMAETSSAQVRVRAYDGEDYSAWSTSPKFSIVKNLPPSKPTQMVPNGGRTVDRTETIRFTWKHNDDGVQAGFRIAWRTVSSSGEAGSWNYVNASGYRQSTNQYFDFAPNTFPAGKIEWRVSTMDQESLTSPWSDIQVFTAGIPSNAPIILSPQQGDIIATSSITVTWSSINQRRYEVQIYDGSTQVYRKAETTTVKNAPIGYSLENNKTYTIKLRIADTQYDIWSEWSEITIQTNFTPPVKPELIIESDEEGNTINVSWISEPSSDPTTPTTISVELYRRRFNSSVEGEWTMIHVGEDNSSYVDYTPASDVTYEYYAKARGDNQTFSDSDIKEAKITFIHAYIHRSLVQSDFIVLRMSDERSEDISRAGRFMSFAGREKPIYEYGYNTDKTIDVTWEVDTNEDYLNTVAFLTRKETFLYRDALGRRMFCIIDGSISVDDNLLSGCTFGVSLREVDFEE